MVGSLRPRLLFAMFLLGLATAGAPSAGSDKADPGWRQEMLRQVNDIRAQHDRAPLTLDDRLNAAAQAHCNEMVRRDFFDHVAPDGSRMTDRADRAGYRWRVIQENIAAGHPNAAQVLDGWMQSQPHRAAILDSRVTDVGFGYAFAPNDHGRLRKKHYWTMLVGRE